MAVSRPSAAGQAYPGQPPHPGQSGAPTAAVEEEPGGSQLIVGRDIQVKGEIASCDTLVVEGRVEASMDSRVIRIADSGVFIGEVGIDYAEIVGRFEGKLTARKRLVIHPTGRVSGTIRYGAIQIEEGGQIMGDVQVIDGPRSGAAESTGSRAPRSEEDEQGQRPRNQQRGGQRPQSNGAREPQADPSQRPA